MGCHTWFYTEVEKPHQELMKEKVLNYFNEKLNENIREVSNQLEWAEIMNFIDIVDESNIEIIKRKIRMIENNHCQKAVINLYCNLLYSSEGIHIYNYKTDKIYKHRKDISDLFRVSNYPNNILYSYGESVDFIHNNTITYI